MSTLLSVLIYRSLCANFRFSVRMHLALMCLSLGTHVPTTWHSRACHLALMCVPLGTHVPTTWHSCACHLALTCLSIGTHVPTTLHSRAYHLALTCLSLGTHVPTTWHLRASHLALMCLPLRIWKIPGSVLGLDIGYLDRVLRGFPLSAEVAISPLPFSLYYSLILPFDVLHMIWAIKNVIRKITDKLIGTPYHIVPAL